MNRVSDERLGELIKLWSDTAGETVHILRELRDYRKAVREYLEAQEDLRMESASPVSVDAEVARLKLAYATLRALSTGD